MKVAQFTSQQKLQEEMIKIEARMLINALKNIHPKLVVRSDK